MYEGWCGFYLFIYLLIENKERNDLFSYGSWLQDVLEYSVKTIKVQSVVQ